MSQKLIHLQLAIFYKEVETRPDQKFSGLNNAMLNMFDMMPTMLPLPLDAPPEIPLVILKGSENGYSCNIARNRIDLIFNPKKTDQNITSNISDFISKAKAFSKYVFNNNDNVRFGLISRYFIKDQNPIETIKKKYLKNTFGDLKELNLRFNKGKVQLGIDLNDIIEISSAIEIDNNKQEQGILIQRDINNDPKAGQKISLGKVQELIEHSVKMISPEETKGLVS